MNISCGHCKSYHDSVRAVRQCAMQSGVPAGSIAEQNGLVSERQPKFTYSERRSGDMPPVAGYHGAGGESIREAGRPMREYSVDAQDDMIPGRHNPTHGAQVDSPVRTKKRADEGMYRKSGTIYKVQKAVHGSGQNYAKRLVQVLTHDPKNHGRPKFRFEYAPGFVFELRSEHKLSLEQAKEFGALYGTCCVCGRTLTKEESIEAGIGPVCASKF